MCWSFLVWSSPICPFLFVWFCFFFTFVSITITFKSQRTSLKPMSRDILPMFFSMYFMISGLTSKSFIHSALIFVYGVRVFWFHAFTCNCTVFPTPFDKQTFLSPLCTLYCLSLSEYTWVHFWSLNSIPLVCVCFHSSIIMLWLLLLCGIIYNLVWKPNTSFLCHSLGYFLALFPWGMPLKFDRHYIESEYCLV